MRILLAHNSLYYPSHGGGDKSNRLLMEALAARGHCVRVIARLEQFGAEPHEHFLRDLASRGLHPESIGPEAVVMQRNGVEVHTLTRSPLLRPYFQRQIDSFEPGVILTSTDDPAQLLLDLALRAPRARVVYLIRATIAAPFGPDSSSRNAARTANLQRVDGSVGVSEYVADYGRQWGGLDTIHVPISLLEPVAPPLLANFDNPYVCMVNPCAVKGISIFLELADRLPDVRFAAVPTWGTTVRDLDALRHRSNITLLEPFDNVDDLLRLTKVMLVPSVWAEARSRMVLESLSRGVPVIASDVGGLHEAMLGVDYLLPVNPVRHYTSAVDEHMVPVAEVPPQNLDPWVRVLEHILTDRPHYEELSAVSRMAALRYLEGATVLAFEAYLEKLLLTPKRTRPAAGPTGLSMEKRKLLELRLQKTAGQGAPGNPWIEKDQGPVQAADLFRLFCFPFAGGGTLTYRNWRKDLPGVALFPIRLPGRESRIDEPPIESMDALVAALIESLSPMFDRPFAFYGHSMGAIVAFEVIRALRLAGAALPRALIVSGARAPQFRLNYNPPPEPAEELLIEELKKLQGMTAGVLENPQLRRLALTSLRADARLYRNYVYQPGEPLAIPIFAYGGASDPNVKREHVQAWERQTTAPFLMREFSGGHFFIQESRPEFIEKLREDIASLAHP